MGHRYRSALWCRRCLDFRLCWPIYACAHAGRHAHAGGRSDSSTHTHGYGHPCYSPAADTDSHT